LGIFNKIKQLFKSPVEELLEERLNATSTPRYHLGCLPSLPDHRDFKFIASVATASLPASVDLRPQFPMVPFDQGRLGSCVAQATAAAIQFDRYKQKKISYTPSRLFIYYNARALQGQVNEDAGTTVTSAMKTVNHDGACSESNWTYNIAKFAVKPSAKAYREALKAQVVAYYRLNNTLDEMKTCLASGFPFVCGVTVYGSFISHTTAVSGDVPIPSKTEPLLGGHAILIVGYDDATGKFIGRNSWGTNWGKQGYFTIPYEYLTNPSLAWDFWVIKAVE
jgi:C1A family cysteine protease